MQPCGVTETFGKGKYHLLDFTRFFAALLVVIFHTGPYAGYEIPRFTGSLCVAYFFMLSGFVLTHAYRDQIMAAGFSFRDYIAARIARLYPLHLITLSTVLFFYFLAFVAVRSGIPLNNDYNWSWIALGEQMTLTHLIFQESVRFNSPSWSIAVEFWASLTIFLLCLPMRKLFKLGVCALFIGAYISTIPSGGFLRSEVAFVHGFIEKNYAVGFALFVFGWILYFAVRALAARDLHVHPAAGLAAAIATLWFLGAPPDAIVQQPWMELAFFAAIAVMLVALALVSVTGARAQRLMTATGDLSYGIYLWHIPVMLFYGAAGKVLERVTGSNPLASIPGTVFYLLIVLVVAWASYRYFELPAKRWLRARLMSGGGRNGGLTSGTQIR